MKRIYENSKCKKHDLEVADSNVTLEFCYSHPQQVFSLKTVHIAFRVIVQGHAKELDYTTVYDRKFLK